MEKGQIGGGTCVRGVQCSQHRSHLSFGKHISFGNISFPWTPTQRNACFSHGHVGQGGYRIGVVMELGVVIGSGWLQGWGGQGRVVTEVRWLQVGVVTGLGWSGLASERFFCGQPL